MGPRRETTDEAATRQLTDSNNTLNRFLGSSRRLSWLNGGSAPINPRPQNSPQRTHDRTVSNTTATTIPITQPNSEQRHASSTSASPNVPNNAPPTAARPLVASISPPQNPAARQSPVPIVVTEIPAPVEILSLPASASEESRKRKQVNLPPQAAASKRVVSGSGNGIVSINPVAPSSEITAQADAMAPQNSYLRWQPTVIPGTTAMVQSVEEGRTAGAQADAIAPQNSHLRWQPTVIPGTTAMVQSVEEGRTAGPQQNWQQAYGASLAQQFVQNGASPSPVQLAQNAASPVQFAQNSASTVQMAQNGTMSAQVTHDRPLPMQTPQNRTASVQASQYRASSAQIAQNGALLAQMHQRSGHVLPSKTPAGNVHLPGHIRGVSAAYSAGQSPGIPSPTVPSPTTPNSAWGPSPNLEIQQAGSTRAEDASPSALQDSAAVTRVLQQQKAAQQNVLPAPQAVVHSSPQPSISISLPIIHPYSRELCEGKILQYMERYNQTNGPMNAVEHARTDLLLKAAREGDSLFIFIHQVVSQSVVDFDNLPSILRNANGFSDTIKMLNHLMAGDFLSNNDLLNFFATLPWSLNYLAMERPDNYQLVVNHIAHMSFSLQNGWNALKQQCLHRGYPPLATELWVLNIYSPTLMDVFFLAIVRQLWASDKPDYVNGTHETAKQIFEDTKSALYSSLDGWLAQPAVVHNISATFHSKCSVFAQQVAARVNSKRQQGHSVPISPSVGAIPSNQRRLSGQIAPNSPATGINGYQNPQMPPMQPLPGQFRPPSRPQNYARPSQPTTPVQPVLQKSALFLPLAGAPRPNQAATATWQMTALHQAHLRDPTFDVPLTTAQDDLLYQSVVGFAVAPRRLNQHELYQNYTFSLPTDARVAQTVDPQDGQRKIRQVDENTLQYRFRIVKVGAPVSGEQEDLATDWMRKATSWPQNMYYGLNDHSLEVRRKQHHTKDLPVDLTEYIKADGEENMLDFYANLSFEEAASTLSKYAFAIEIVAATTHKAILEASLQRTIPSADSLRAITASLAPRPSTGNDEIIVDAARTNIQIYDPISQSAICAIPARGTDCKHKDCFDLSTFLQTRPRERPHWPTEVDVWKCPICLQDVRPHKIVVDGFFRDVREQLVAQGREKTRVIVVEADGSWTPKVEEDVGSERSTPEVDGGRAEEVTAKPVMDRSTMVGYQMPVAQGPKRKQMVVIDLCEDD